MKKTDKKTPYEAPEGVAYTVHPQNGMCLVVSGGNEAFVLDDYDGEWIEG